MTTSGRGDEPIFEAEQAPPTMVEQVRAAIATRRSQPATSGSGAKGAAIGIGKALIGSLAGVMVMLGALGLGMTALMGLYVLITTLGGGDLGVHWAVVPMSLLVFSAMGLVGYWILRSLGLVRRRRT